MICAFIRLLSLERISLYNRAIKLITFFHLNSVSKWLSMTLLFNPLHFLPASVASFTWRQLAVTCIALFSPYPSLSDDSMDYVSGPKSSRSNGKQVPHMDCLNILGLCVLCIEEKGIFFFQVWKLSAFFGSASPAP